MFEEWNNDDTSYLFKYLYILIEYTCILIGIRLDLNIPIKIELQSYGNISTSNKS